MQYNPALDQPRQQNRWSCLPSSIAWGARALGADLSTSEFGLQVLHSRVITLGGYLVDKTGREVWDFTLGALGPYGLAAVYAYDASFDEVAVEAGLYPLVVGSGSWLHYAAVRDYDPASGLLLLANSSPGWMSIGSTMSRQQFDRYRPVSLTRVAPTELAGEIGERIEHSRRRGWAAIERPPAVLVGPRALPFDPIDGRRLTWGRGRGVLRQLRR